MWWASLCSHYSSGCTDRLIGALTGDVCFSRPAAGRIPLVDLKANYASMKKDIDAGVRDVFDSGWFIGGPKVDASAPLA